MTSTYVDLAEPKTACLGAHVPQHIADEIDALARSNFRSTSAELRLAIVKHLEDHRRGALTAA